MSFFYIKLRDHDRIPLWDYCIINELENTSKETYRLHQPARLATTSDGLLYVTNDRDTEIIVIEEDTLTLKGVKRLAASDHAAASKPNPPWLDVPTSIGSSPFMPTVCVLPKAGFQDGCNLYTLTANVNGCFLKVSSANLGHWNACSVCTAASGDLLVGNSRYNKVYTYRMSKGFVGDRNVNCKPSYLAYDYKQCLLHVCDSGANIIKVFAKGGGDEPLYEYGRNTLIVPTQVAIDSNSCSYVVCSFNLSCFLAVFDSNGDHIYSIYGFDSPSGVAVSSDKGTVWVSDTKRNSIVKFDGLCTLRPPFSMSLVCKKAILLHMNEIAMIQLPTRLAAAFSSWTQPVKLDIKGLLCSPLTVDLILKRGLKVDIIKWFVCHRLNLPEQIKMIFRTSNGRHTVTQLAHYMDKLTVELFSTIACGPKYNCLIPSCRSHSSTK